MNYEYKTTVLNGLPVIIKWVILGEDSPASWDEPESFEEIEWEVCDIKGRYAAWIDKRLTDTDKDIILDELWSEAKGMKQDYWDY